MTGDDNEQSGCADDAGECGHGDANEGVRAPLDIPEPGLPQAKVDFLYRVFCAKREMPPFDLLMERLIAKNPQNPEGGFVFPPGQGMRRLQEALGASPQFSCVGYERHEAPELFAAAEAALGEEAHRFEESDRLTVEKGHLCIVLRAEIANPPTNEYVETMAHLADAFCDLLHGVVWDVYMKRMWARSDWPQVMDAVMSPESHVRVMVREGADSVALTTAGLVKFGSPDLEIARVPIDMKDDASAFLLDSCEHLMQGDLLLPDDVVTYRDTELRVVATPAREGRNEVLRIVDAPLDPDAPLAPSDGSEGAPRLIEAIRGARVEREGQRATGGMGAL